MLNLYAIYARNGTINILLPFTDLLRNVQPYVVRTTSFSSHLLLRSWDVSSSLYLLFIKANTYLSYNLRSAVIRIQDVGLTRYPVIMTWIYWLRGQFICVIFKDNTWWVISMKTPITCIFMYHQLKSELVKQLVHLWIYMFLKIAGNRSSAVFWACWKPSLDGFCQYILRVVLSVVL